MAISLAELKQQREQIQQHLDWLDAKIAECNSTAEGAETSMPPPSGGGEAEPKLSAKPDEAIEESLPKETTKAPAEPELAGTAAAAPVHTPDIEAPTYKAKTQDEIRRAKVGCFVLFILGTALFLFLLFGLPYLL